MSARTWSLLRRMAGGIALAAALAHALAVPAAQAGYSNPVIPGFHADPSICRVGGDYYLATSSFEYFPGVPIFHSKDLVHWKQIGHALTRESQLPLTGQRSSRGIFAPTLRCHDGVFYLITTNIGLERSFYVHTRDPAGPWSEPVWIKESGTGMDPSLLFDDDGKVYYTRHGGGEHGGVYQAEIDIASGVLAAEPRQIWAGTGGIWPEGPHLYKVGSMYYLMISEGGTSYEHSLTMARSASPWGPFEADAANPMLTHRYRPELPLQATGHGDLVQSATGQWWMVLLGVRPLARQHHLGRETLLSPVAWNAQGWLTINGGQPLQEQMQASGLPAAAPWPPVRQRDDFAAPQLGLDWTFLRGPATGLWSLTERPGWLRLKGTQATMNDIATPAFVGRRQEHLRMRARTRLAFAPALEGQSAGLVLRQNEANHYDLRIAGAGKRRVELITTIAGVATMVGSAPIGDGLVTLQLDAEADHYTFSYSVGKGAMRVLGSAPTAPLSSERAGGFTGVFIGLVASTTQPGPMPVADVDWFDTIPMGR